MLGSPKLRDSHLLKRPYPLGELTEECLLSICKSLAYQMAVGDKDLSGEKWEQIFAKGIEGINLSRPLGLADVVKDSFSWSVKTLKVANPHKASKVRIISGRNNVNYSYGIENPLEDIETTGEAVLSIFNERLKTAKSEYKDLTHSILVRSPNFNEFTYFEKEAEIIDPKTISWEKNKNGNLQGYDLNKNHVYTWQPDGSQFTIIYQIPENAIRFTLKKPESLDFDSVIELIGFDDSWVTKK
ncbi:hypothetical protein NB559_21805 [Vibrio parahaemolyticus]|uniref:Uncharacterized protein n=1 Tax=Vibrio parahaemolyticus TaxID=670 RepID=A0A9Q3UCC9_VIBPH|nr:MULTISPECIES: hypothetical protein [Vibrio]CAH1572111.1 conserved hypothetical protein [Vibrio harveyi]HAS6237042.1 hypothetical protein [Vibrio vulnificus]MCC3805100.1 hypothetical protein [Vibrio parahaemolyticus]MCR9652480.1 hypothetical protein [Vibrio parahaemolyticus]MCR9854990.1 hypothetical protein [Vibrio parahaemolyticus]